MDEGSSVARLLRADALPLRERVLLKDNAANLLREHIVTGRLPPGTKLVEQALSEALGISRMPIRDALMKLEEEGVVIARSTGRFVAELSRQDVLELYQVRLVMERLAVQLAARRLTEDDAQALRTGLSRMQAALRERDQLAFVRTDLDIHRAIWTASGNACLKRTLEHLLGPMLIFVSNTAVSLDWEETLDLHARLVGRVLARDVAGGLLVMQQHMDSVVGEADPDGEIERMDIQPGR